MNRSTIVLFLIVFLCISCEEESPAPSVDPTSISVNCNKSKDDPFLVDETMVFSIKLNTDPSVGIASFTIEKSGSEIFSRSDYTANIVNFEFTYDTKREDLGEGEFVFSFILIDKNGTRKQSDVSVKVAVDLPIIIEDLNPGPGWNLVADQVADTSDTKTVDIYQFTVVVNPFTVETYWTSFNESKFYDVSDLSIDFFDINLPYTTLENAISGRTPVDTLSVGTPGPLPMIIDLRGSSELILVDRSNVAGSKVGYRKRE